MTRHTISAELQGYTAGREAYVPTPSAWWRFNEAAGRDDHLLDSQDVNHGDAVGAVSADSGRPLDGHRTWSFDGGFVDITTGDERFDPADLTIAAWVSPTDDANLAAGDASGGWVFGESQSYALRMDPTGAEFHLAGGIRRKGYGHGEYGAGGYGGVVGGGFGQGTFGNGGFGEEQMIEKSVSGDLSGFAGTSITAGEWYFVVATFREQARTMRLYVFDRAGNGGMVAEDAEARVVLTANQDDQAIGRRHRWHETDPFRGHIADVKWYDRPLADAFVHDLAGAGLVERPPDYTVPEPDIARLDMTRRRDRKQPVGSANIHNNNGDYVPGDVPDSVLAETGWGADGWGTSTWGSGPTEENPVQITPGDRLRFRAQLDGDDHPRWRWTAMARGVTLDRSDVADARLRVEMEGFVHAVLGIRATTGGYEDRPVVTSEAASTARDNPDEGIVNDLLREECPELDRVLLPDLVQTTDTFQTGSALLDVVNDLATLAGVTVWGEDDMLRFEDVDDQLTTAFALDAPDKTGSHGIDLNDDNVANRIRVDGGTDKKLDDSHETVSAFTAVGGSRRAVQRVDTRKAYIASVELYTLNTGTGQLTVRIQAGDEAAPVDASDTASDVASRTLSHEFLETEGWTEFIIPEHTIPDRTPWVIIEATDGIQHIGVDTTIARPAYRTYYGYPLSSRIEDGESQAKFRRRDAYEGQKGLATRRAVVDRARTAITERGEPRREFEFEAESVRAHNLAPADGLDIDRPRDGFAYRCVVESVSDSYEAHQLATAITARAHKEL